MIKHNAFNADQKILKHLDKLDYFFNGHKTLVVCELDLTNRCNNKCPGCIGTNENGAQLAREQVDRIVDSLDEIGCSGVILSGGGEPLISPHFAYAVERLRKAGIKLGLNSNGLALTEELSRLIAGNCEYFRISLDAATPQMYELTHGMPSQSFERVVENCRLFADVRNETGSKCSYGLGFLTDERTRGEMEAFVQMAKEAGADFAQFRPFQDDHTDVTADIQALQQQYNGEGFHVTGSMQKYREMTHADERPYGKCRGMFFSTVVTADAKAFACLHYRQSDAHYLGTIDEHTTLSDIFRSARMREVYESIDCAHCPTLCRNDVFNRTLETLSLDVNHIEFM